MKKVFIFLAGAALGSVVTYKVTERYFNKLIDQEIESVKETFKERLAKIEENYLLLLETTKRLAVNEHKAAIPEVELMEHFGIADSDLKEVEDLEFE